MIDSPAARLDVDAKGSEGKTGSLTSDPTTFGGRPWVTADFQAGDVVILPMTTLVRQQPPLVSTRQSCVSFRFHRELYFSHSEVGAENEMFC